MSKDFKKSPKNKTKKKKNKMGNRPGRILPSLAKNQASSNWLNFLKSNGSNTKLEKFFRNSSEERHPKMQKLPDITKVLAVDCEMVSGLNDEVMLARVSIVNYNLQCVYDKFVKPTAEVGDYRTRFSGIREENLREATDFEKVRREVLDMLKNKILVGHALFNDLKALRIQHPDIFIRDTSAFPLFRDLNKTMRPSLKKLAKQLLNETIQEGEHCSVEDAKTTMRLYKKYHKEWELLIANKSKSV